VATSGENVPGGEHLVLITKIPAFGRNTSNSEQERWQEGCYCDSTQAVDQTQTDAPGQRAVSHGGLRYKMSITLSDTGLTVGPSPCN